MIKWHRLTAVCSLATMLPVFLLAGCVTTTSVPRTQVQWGEYLARAGDCQACHTDKNHILAPFAGGNRLNTPFGYMLTPNITPDRDTGIGRWSGSDFYRALHDGVNKRGEDMYPTMPYLFDTKVSRKDIDAIYAYLKTVKPVKNAVNVNHLRFPYNQRQSLIAWRALYFHKGTFKPDTARSAVWNRGAYLVEGLGHCSDCHSPRNSLGAIEKKRKFSGALLNGWYGLNLTSDLGTGLGSWTAMDIATYLKTGAFHGKTTAIGPMREVVQDSTRYLSDDDLKAIGEYLKSLSPISRPGSGVKPDEFTRKQGARLYVENCAGCHQREGTGVYGEVPPLAGNGAVIAPDPSDVIRVIIRGIPERGSYLPMPSFALRSAPSFAPRQLTDAEIAEISNYIRTSWGNAAPVNATGKLVAKLRDSVAARQGSRNH
ncbi:MAG: c-type cytochrome [Acidiferrobacterales bacterium]